MGGSQSDKFWCWWKNDHEVLLLLELKLRSGDFSQRKCTPRQGCTLSCVTRSWLSDHSDTYFWWNLWAAIGLKFHIIFTFFASSSDRLQEFELILTDIFCAASSDISALSVTSHRPTSETLTSHIQKSKNEIELDLEINLISILIIHAMTFQPS